MTLDRRFLLEINGLRPHQVRLEARRRVVGLLLLLLEVQAMDDDELIVCVALLRAGRVPRREPRNGLAVRGGARHCRSAAARRCGARCCRWRSVIRLAVAAAVAVALAARPGGVDRTAMRWPVGLRAARARHLDGSSAPSSSTMGSDAGAAWRGLTVVVVSHGERAWCRLMVVPVFAGMSAGEHLTCHSHLASADDWQRAGRDRRARARLRARHGDGRGVGVREASA